MEVLILEPTKNTPAVQFDQLKGEMRLSGRSTPENSHEFFQPLYEWVEQYARLPQEHTTVVVQLEYFNTSSSKCLLDLFKSFNRILNEGHSVSVKWYFEEEDEDMEEAGEDYGDLLDLPFEIIKVEELPKQ